MKVCGVLATHQRYKGQWPFHPELTFLRSEWSPWITKQGPGQVDHSLGSGHSAGHSVGILTIGLISHHALKRQTGAFGAIGILQSGQPVTGGSVFRPC
jgi:hypothetical protein